MRKQSVFQEIFLHVDVLILNKFGYSSLISFIDPPWYFKVDLLLHTSIIFYNHKSSVSFDFFLYNLQLLYRQKTKNLRPLRQRWSHQWRHTRSSRPWRWIWYGLWLLYIQRPGRRIQGILWWIRFWGSFRWYFKKNNNPQNDLF